MAFLQDTINPAGNGTISQVFDASVDGTYSISFYSALRANWMSTNIMSSNVMIDGTNVETFLPTSQFNTSQIQPTTRSRILSFGVIGAGMDISEFFDTSGPGCIDWINNRTEIDVDCDGTCPTKCANDKLCLVNSGCSSGNCLSSPNRQRMFGSFELVQGKDVVALDTDGKEILNQSGDVRKFGDTYYWYGDRIVNGVRIGIICYSSKDLAHWTFNGVVKSIPASPPSDPTAESGMRPSVVYNRASQQYVMIFQRAIHFATSATPTGRFVDQGYAMIPNDRGGGDRRVFLDDDGKVYVVYATWPYPDQFNTDIGIVLLTPDYLHVDRVVAATTGMHCEAPYILKRNGVYYLFASQCNGWSSSTTSYATATNLAGPWSSPKTVTTIPSDSQSFNSQHDLTVTIVGTKGTAYMYFGDRWSEYTGRGIGKNVRLPLTFDGNEPVLNGLNSWYINVITGEWSPTPVP